MWERSRGLLGRAGFDEAILLRRAFLLHTLRMRFPIDVAFCTRDLKVVDVITARPNRLIRPRVRTRNVIEATGGAFSRWGVTTGTILRIEQDR